MFSACGKQLAAEKHARTYITIFLLELSGGLMKRHMYKCTNQSSKEVFSNFLSIDGSLNQVCQSIGN